eukprot:365053-Chlamydomonas_euryale.AAC.5
MLRALRARGGRCGAVPAAAAGAAAARRRRGGVQCSAGVGAGRAGRGAVRIAWSHQQQPGRLQPGTQGCGSVGIAAGALHISRSAGSGQGAQARVGMREA